MSKHTLLELSNTVGVVKIKNKHLKVFNNIDTEKWGLYITYKLIPPKNSGKSVMLYSSAYSIQSDFINEILNMFDNEEYNGYYVKVLLVHKVKM